MRLLAVVASLCVIGVFAVTSARQGRSAPKVKAIFEEIESLIEHHYNIPRHDYSADVKDSDIIYTESQARVMLVGLKQKLGYATKNDRVLTNTTKLWGFPILYSFNKLQFTSERMSQVRSAINIWSSATCLQFEERDESQINQNDPYILFNDANGGCSSFVGRQVERGPQQIYLGPSCHSSATIAHLVGHTIGLFHEQSRRDRDDHVTVYWENIAGGTDGADFGIEPADDPIDTPFDYSSIMMFSSTSYSKDETNRLRTLMPHALSQLGAMGQRFELSFNDAKRVNHAYMCTVFLCNKAELSVDSCKNGGYQDPGNCAICRCPSGTSGNDCSLVEPPKGRDMATCGGEIVLQPCELKTLALPTYPGLYSPGSSCNWKVNTASKGLIFSFQSRPDMFCDSSDTCYDYVEIRSGRLDAPGKYFCKCTTAKGRVAVIDNPKDVLVRFVARPQLNEEHLPGSGFLLNVYSTCNNTLASQVPTSCRTASTSFDVCSNVILPLCPTAIRSSIEPATLG